MHVNEPEEHSVSIGELAGYRLWNLVRKARFYDRESLGVELSGEEQDSAWASFCVAGRRPEVRICWRV